MTFLYWTYAVLTLIGIGANLTQIDKPRKPLSVGAVLIATIIAAVQAFILFAAAVRW